VREVYFTLTSSIG